jgi:hypothetical protein
LICIQRNGQELTLLALEGLRVSETANIAEFAAIVSGEVFANLGWERVGAVDQNWPCTRPEEHDCSTHPSDVVFRYDDPFNNKAIYVNADLKSYKSNSIELARISGAIKSLARSVECANASADWQDLYLRGSESHDVVGMLFVLNNDGQYTPERWPRLLNSLEPDDVAISARNRLFLLGPQDVTDIASVTDDLVRLRGKNVLPLKDYCNFLYPDCRLLKPRKTRWPALSLEAAYSSWIIVHYEFPDESPPHRQGLVIYYKGPGVDQYEFSYFIDYLFNYQVFSDYKNIQVRLVNCGKSGALLFEKAKSLYAMQNLADKEASRLKAVSVESILQLSRPLYEAEIGLQRAN